MEAQRLKKLANKGLLTAQQLQDFLGVSQPTISRLVKTGAIQRHGHGLYAHPKLKIPPDILDFAIACSKFGPQSAIGGLSALFHYGLLDQPPSQLWVVVPPEKSNHNNFYRMIRTKTPPVIEADTLEHYRITNVERTILEALKFAPKIGVRVAINAARDALKKKLTTEKKLGEVAKRLRLHAILEKYWEMIVL
jgi:predicted transcriptional regulator of viral defense system